MCYERSVTHGDPNVGFVAIAEMWQTYLRASNAQRHLTLGTYLEIDAIDVAQMMSLVKKMRWLFGNHDPDNFVDDLGYVAIAGQLAAPPDVETKSQPAVRHADCPGELD